MTALVIVLQLLVVIKLGAFNISVVMMPIVVGAALLGPSAGAWLGFVFGVTVLLSAGFNNCEHEKHLSFKLRLAVK